MSRNKEVEGDLQKLYKALDNDKFYQELEKIIKMDPLKINIGDAYYDEITKQKRAISTIRVLVNYDDYRLLKYSLTRNPSISRFLYKYAKFSIFDLRAFAFTLVSVLSQIGPDSDLLRLLEMVIMRIWTTSDLGLATTTFFTEYGHALLDIGHGSLFDKPNVIYTNHDPGLLKRAIETKNLDVIHAFINVYKANTHRWYINRILNSIKINYSAKKAFDYAREYAYWKTSGAFTHQGQYHPKPDPKDYDL